VDINNINVNESESTLANCCTHSGVLEPCDPYIRVSQIHRHVTNAGDGSSFHLFKGLVIYTTIASIILNQYFGQTVTVRDKCSVLGQATGKDSLK
jgi:hypothetical protein